MAHPPHRNGWRRHEPPLAHATDESHRLLDYALGYASLGMYVFPLDPGTKHPLGRLVHHGMKDASISEPQLRAWWTQYPQAGIGLALKKSGLAAVDIDPRNGGLHTLEALEAKHGPIVSDVTAFTGGGGEHRVFAAGQVTSLLAKLGPGVDLKYDGYICVEPTFASLAEPPHAKPYVWEASSNPLEGAKPSPLPDWIAALGSQRNGHVVDHLPPTSAPVPALDGRRKASAVAALEFIASDERETWLQVGMAIHQEMPGCDGFDLWSRWSQRSPKYDPQDQLRVWRSFHRRPLDDRRLDLTLIFATAQRAGWKNDGGARPAPEVPAQKSKQPTIRIMNLAQLDIAAGAVTWTIKHVLPGDSVGMMFGAPGTFKSFIALDMALHVAHGMKWLGRKTSQGSVLYIAAEGGTGLMRRIRAWHLARGLSWQNIAFHVIAEPIALNTHAQDVVDAAKAVGVVPRLVIVDTKSQTDEGEENSSTDTAHYFRELGLRFRALWACTVLVTHHNGHSATERPRGSSAITGNVDFMFAVFRDEKEMLATLECHRQKDGDPFAPANFSFSSELLGKDEDGEEIRSLAARYINNTEELIEAVSKEAAAGRGGNNSLLLSLIQNGMPQKELRKIFYDSLGHKDIDTKRQAWLRCIKWATRAGYIEVAQGTVIVLQDIGGRT